MNVETGKSWKITNIYLSLTQLEHCSSLNAAAQENLSFSNINFRGLWKISAMLSDFSRIKKNKNKSTSQTKDQECVSTCSCSVCNKKQWNARDHFIQLIEFSQKRIIWTDQCQNLKHQESIYPTCRTGLETRYFSRKALGAMSYMIEVARCAKMLSIVCLGCCLRITIVMIVMMMISAHLVILRYFWRGLARDGKMDWAAS